MGGGGGGSIELIFTKLINLVSLSILSIKPLFSMVDGLVPILPTLAASGDRGGILGTVHCRQIGKIGPSAGI